MIEATVAAIAVDIRVVPASPVTRYPRGFRVAAWPVQSPAPPQFSAGVLAGPPCPCWSSRTS